MQQQRSLFASLIAVSFALTAIIWLTAGSLQMRFDVVNEKYFAFFYPWQTRNPSTMAYITAWVGYALHNIAAWTVIWLAQRSRPKYDTRFRWFNWAMVIINLAGFGLHWVQTQLWYDGLAIAVPEVTSQGSVILMLVFILILETPRRGLIWGKKVKFHKAFLDIVRRYHGYLFSWALIYTFWYHPMENTFGHLAGFFYMLVLLSQSVLLFNRAHVNKWWTFSLETLVLVHGTLVAIYQGNGMWPMFLFGFAALIVLTQMHGLGLSSRTRIGLGIAYVIGTGLFYWLSGDLARMNEVIRIPAIEYLAVFLFYIIFLGINGLTGLLRRSSRQALSGASS
ncbi:MAG: hypothetical protein D6790_18285 [Caldilineae bacterium]|nr:MAG: hypothetical protein D6790_18285 [Caldilineae bacterium]